MEVALADRCILGFTFKFLFSFSLHVGVKRKGTKEAGILWEGAAGSNKSFSFQESERKEKEEEKESKEHFRLNL